MGRRSSSVRTAALPCGVSGGTLSAVSAKLAAHTDVETVQQYELLKKNLQVIESGIKLWQTWSSKAELAKGIFAFERQWPALMVFVDTPPKVPLDCSCLWDLMLKVKSYAPMSLAAALTSSALAVHVADPAAHAGVQNHESRHGTINKWFFEMVHF